MFTSLLLATTLFVTTAFATGSTASAQVQKAIDVKVDGKQVQFDAPPEVLQGRTMIPIRAVVETMGAEVKLSGKDYFTISKGATVIKIVWNSKTAYVNGKSLQLPIPAYTKNGRTYVPLRFVSEALAATVGYDNETNTALVESFDLISKKGAKVQSVQDGETLQVLIDGVPVEVHLAGIDAPDLAKDNQPPQPVSQEAADYLRDLLTNRTVYLEYEPAQQDPQGRMFAYVYQVDGTFINADVIQHGYARVLTDIPSKRYFDLFNALEKEARHAKKGIWGVPAVPRKPESLKLAFPVISDTHVQSWDMLSHQKFRTALEDLYQIDSTADALVVNGDLGNGQPDDFTIFRRIINSVPHPKNTFYTIGNHEYYKAWFKGGKASLDTFPNGETEQMSIDRFLQMTKENKVYYDRWVKGYHFIFLGSEKYRQSILGLEENAYLSPEQLQWLEGKLNETKDTNQPVFVFLHQPLPYTVAGSGLELGVMQFRELGDILSKHPQAILFSGHTHWDLKYREMVWRDKFTAVNSGTVIRPYDPATDISDSNKSQGLYVEVHDDKVVIRGREFSTKTWIPGAEHTIPRTKNSD
jgi:endonuclease YncB( thermonuclease family)